MEIIIAVCSGINLGFLIVALILWGYILIKDVKETRKIYKKLKEVVDKDESRKKEET